MSVKSCKNELSILYSNKNIQKDERKENISKAKQIISLHNEKIIDTNISIISTGPERSQTIDKNNLLNNI